MSRPKDSTQNISNFKDAREAELNYKIIAENIADAIIRINENSNIVFVSGAAEKIFGYEQSEMVGQNLTFLMPDYLKHHHSNAIQRYLVTGEKKLDWKRVEVPGKHKNGKELSLEISFSEYTQDEKRFFVGVIRDVSDRTKIEKSIRDSEKILQGTLDALTAHIAVLDNKGTILKVNKAWRDFAQANNFAGDSYGIGDNYIEACEPQNQNNDDCRFQGNIACDGIRDVISGKIPIFEMEYPCHSPTEFRWFIMRVTPYSDEDFPGIVVAHENITTRKLAQKETQKSEQKYRTLSEAMPAFMFITNNDGHTTFANRQWFEYTGFTKEQTYGIEWTNAIHQEDFPRVVAEWSKAVEEKKIFESEFRLQRLDGEYRWYLVRVVPRKDNEDEIIDWFGTGTDIEDRKQIEEELRASEIFNRAVLESSPDCVKLIDENGRVQYMNANGMNLMEIDDLDPLIDRNWRDLWQEDNQHLVDEAFKTAISGETARFQAFRPTVKGTSKWWDVIVLPIEKTKSKDNKARVLSVSRDITETKRISEALLKAEVEQRKQAEAANRAKDEFLSVLSHELRTPLNAMLGWVRMLKSGNLDKSRIDQAIEVIERNIILQNELIEDLLDVSRIISGKMLIQKKAVDFSPIVSNALDITRPLADKKNISLSFNNSVGFERILGDETRLSQIIINLLNNAVKFTPNGGSVKINLSNDDKTLYFEITDTGIGIEAKFLPHIFERFRQADSTTKRNFSGLGLGLTIVGHLTELHKGKVEVLSEGVGKGSTFKLEFPLYISNDKEIATSNSAEKEVSSNQTDFPLSNTRILLVDDDIDGLIPLQILLQQQKVEIEIANSADEALKLLNENIYDILISDIGMPETDGYEFIKKLRQSNKNSAIPAIALTAYASLNDRDKALKLGFQKHISKPLDFDKLIKMLKDIRENSRAR